MYLHKVNSDKKKEFDSGIITPGDIGQGYSPECFMNSLDN